MVLGEVSGFRIRSNRVATDSTLGLRRSSGLESNRTKAINPSDRTPAAAATRITLRRLRVMTSSNRARLLKPTSSSSPGGLSSISMAKHGDGEQEGHDHADAGDLSQFGHAGIGGGEEGEKARGGGGGRQCQ